MGKVRVKKKSFFAYIAMTFSFMGSCAIFQGTGGLLQWTLFYYGGPLILAVLSLYYVSLNRDIRVRKERRFFIRLFCAPRVIMLLYSCVIWVVSNTAFPYVSRGISNTLFQCTAYICGVCIACGEKDDILEISLASAITVFGLAYLNGFIQNGISFIYALNPFDVLADSFRKYTELHEVAYIVGLCILMNLIIGKRTSLKKKNVSIAFNKLSPIPLLYVDHTKLQQVFHNLLRNAFEAVKEGGHIVCSIESDGTGVTFKVTDDGCGISPEYRNSIFEPFVTYKPDGSGLGLAISKRIAEAHKGSLEFTSSPEKGTTFILKIPIL